MMRALQEDVCRRRERKIKRGHSWEPGEQWYVAFGDFQGSALLLDSLGVIYFLRLCMKDPFKVLIKYLNPSDGKWFVNAPVRRGVCIWLGWRSSNSTIQQQKVRGGTELSMDHWGPISQAHPWVPSLSPAQRASLPGPWEGGEPVTAKSLDACLLGPASLL